MLEKSTTEKIGSHFFNLTFIEMEFLRKIAVNRKHRETQAQREREKNIRQMQRTFRGS